MNFTTRPELRGTFGAVTSTHWLASATGGVRAMRTSLLKSRRLRFRQPPGATLPGRLSGVAPDLALDRYEETLALAGCEVAQPDGPGVVHEGLGCRVEAHDLVAGNCRDMSPLGLNAACQTARACVRAPIDLRQMKSDQCAYWPPGLGRDHDLSLLLIRFHVSVGSDNLT